MQQGLHRQADRLRDVARRAAAIYVSQTQSNALTAALATGGESGAATWGRWLEVDTSDTGESHITLASN